MPMPSNAGVPGSEHARPSRKTPVPIILPPPYNGDAPNKGLGLGIGDFSLSSAASTATDSVLSPTRTDGTQTPLTSVGSPACFSLFEFEDAMRKPSSDGLMEPHVRDCGWQEAVPEIDQDTVPGLADPDSSSPTTTIRPDEAAENFEAVEASGSDLLETRPEAVPSSAFSVSSSDDSDQGSILETRPTSHSSIELTLINDGVKLRACSDVNDKATSDERLPWHGTNLEDNFLNHAGLDTQSRRTRRPSSTVSIPAEPAPMAVSSESSPPLAAQLAQEKIALDAFDDEKIFVAETNPTTGVSVQIPEQSYHVPWSHDVANGTIADHLSPLSPPTNSPVQRITALHYAQSRHEYSKNRRMMAFHLRERETHDAGQKRTMHIDSSNQNPSVLAAELHDQCHVPIKSELHGESSSSSSSPSYNSKANLRNHPPAFYRSSFEREEAGRAAPGGFFATLFGSCFGRAR